MFESSAGDHSYKQVKELSADKQMITALPDIKVETVNPKTDEFMVLACDGIWNSMTSQQVVDFVRAKLEQKTERLSQICEEVRAGARRASRWLCKTDL